SAGEYWQVEDAVLLPPPIRRTPLMIGSKGPRQLAATLPYADSWNTWFDAYGNSAEGFVPLNATISEAARAAGRDPAELERSACVLVGFGDAPPERRPLPESPPLRGNDAQIARALHDLAEAGADEAILVLDPISEDSVRRCAGVLQLLDAV
ncbi:MAG: LLM class flavin-dependent oxidoreductase, partial [Gaiellales bacterium]